MSQSQLKGHSCLHSFPCFRSSFFIRPLLTLPVNIVLSFYASIVFCTSIIGLKKLHDTITLEPGCQFELSVEPQLYVRDLKQRIDEIDSKIKPLLDDFEIKFLNTGVSPKTTYKKQA